MTILPTLSVAFPRDGSQPEAQARPPTLRAASFTYEPEIERKPYGPLVVVIVSLAMWAPIGFLIWNLVF